MFKRFLILSLLVSCTIVAFTPMPGEPQLIIHNRVLAKVNGDTISVLDLMKKMEFIFYREFPQYANSIEARYQFFNINWRSILNEMIDADLIIANAKDVKFAVSDGDVRQEIEKIFGPNVVENIDKLDMTYPEVFKLVANDITVKQMTYAMAQLPALNRIGPKDVRKAYETFCKEHPIEETWNYFVISIKATSQLKGKALSELAYKLLTQNHIAPENLEKTLQEQHLLSQDASVTVSEDFQRKKSELSDAHRDVLVKMAEKTYCEPIYQVSRTNNGQFLYRIFYIKSHTEQTCVPLADMEEMLKGELLEKVMAEETARYRKKLRTRFNIDDDYLKMTIPEGFEPFSLKK